MSLVDRSEIASTEMGGHEPVRLGRIASATIQSGAFVSL
jgi:hypothetical protein